MAQEESSAAFAALAEELEIQEALMASQSLPRWQKVLLHHHHHLGAPHVATKIQGGIITPVTCPGPDCKSALKFDACKSVLSKNVLELWEKALSQELIDASQGIYCPFKDCSGKLVYENDGEDVLSESECPYCHRLFCAHCYVPWHPGVNCEEYQSLNDDERGREDLMMRELVKKKQLRKCPNCKYHIERTGGCLHMTCL
ncbi:hypothetical protein WN944_022702 [Citrus x changshan-huyou]|uniref:RBR-type E3 ubiquitin transferase n=1 Tax=Citrus x changshan-huyou TaxID=2935761 RepID=A0AAP0N1L6_9ROSI